MGWEKRGRGTRYYTRSRWVDGRVVREYVGSGSRGKIAALEDECKRRQREMEAAFRKEERERLEVSAAFLEELEEAAEVLVRANLVGAGYRKRKGQWRREHDRNGA
jgi:hypothetical protein